MHLDFLCVKPKLTSGGGFLHHLNVKHQGKQKCLNSHSLAIISEYPRPSTYQSFIVIYLVCL